MRCEGRSKLFEVTNTVLGHISLAGGGKARELANNEFARDKHFGTRFRLAPCPHTTDTWHASCLHNRKQQLVSV
jgi:hypothetical protein